MGAVVRGKLAETVHQDGLEGDLAEACRNSAVSEADVARVEDGEEGHEGKRMNAANEAGEGNTMYGEAESMARVDDMHPAALEDHWVKKIH